MGITGRRGPKQDFGGKSGLALLLMSPGNHDQLSSLVIDMRPGAFKVPTIIPTVYYLLLR